MKVQIYYYILSVFVERCSEWWRLCSLLLIQIYLSRHSSAEVEDLPLCLCVILNTPTLVHTPNSTQLVFSHETRLFIYFLLFLPLFLSSTLWSASFQLNGLSNAATLTLQLYPFEKKQNENISRYKWTLEREWYGSERSSSSSSQPIPNQKM